MLKYYIALCFLSALMTFLDDYYSRKVIAAHPEVEGNPWYLHWAQKFKFGGLLYLYARNAIGMTVGALMMEYMPTPGLQGFGFGFPVGYSILHLYGAIASRKYFKNMKK